MTNDAVIDLGTPEGIDPLTDLVRCGARRLIAEAIEAELADMMTDFAEQKSGDGRKRVVRSGHHPEREILTGVGKVTVRVPKIRSREGEPVSFQSCLVPPTSARRRHRRLDDILAPSVFLAYSLRLKPFAVLVGYRRNIRVAEDVETEGPLLSVAFDLPTFTLY